MIISKLTEYPIETLRESVCHFGGLVNGKCKPWLDPKDGAVIDSSLSDGELPFEEHDDKSTRAI